MTLGDIRKFASKSSGLKLYSTLFGTPDIHSHIRWRSMKKYISLSADKNAEIGGGWGIMSFEFVKITGNSIDCVEMNPKSIDLGREIADKAKLHTEVTFIEDSLPQLVKIKKDYYDQILLIDVLEHVNDDQNSLITINSLLKWNGCLVISVPTPNYPKYFGSGFADAIGHVRDGYTIEDLNTLLRSSGFELVEWSYHTNLLSSYLCEIWYKYLSESKIKYALLPLLPLSKLLSYLDFAGRGTNSCGIALKARKVRKI